MTVREQKWVCLAATKTWGKWWPCRRRVTRGPAGAARQNQSSAKLIFLSICLRAAEADGGGVIVLGVICIETIYFIFFFFLFFFAPKSHGYGGQISQPILPALCLSLSCFRLHRRADNWMKNSSCVGRCCVCLCAYVGFKAWLHFMSDELFVCLRSSVDA